MFAAVPSCVDLRLRDACRLHLCAVLSVIICLDSGSSSTCHGDAASGAGMKEVAVLVEIVQCFFNMFAFI